MIKWDKKPILFTFPPYRIPYNYIIINAAHFDRYMSYIYKFYKYIDMIIIDSGVEIFRDPNVKDYPSNYFYKIIYIYDLVKKYVRNTYVTVPDYPDDYHHKALWINNKITNIERTLLNVEHALTNYSDINWVIPVQGWNNNPFSVVRSIMYYEEWGILKKYDYYGIANLCVSKRCSIIESTIKLAYPYLRNKKIHVFGIAINCLKNIKNYIYSFDSVAYTKPVSRLKKLGYNYSAKNYKQRELYFYEWIKSVEKYIQ